MMRLWRWLSENSRGWNRWDPIDHSFEPVDQSALDDLWGPYSLGIWDGIEWDTEGDRDQDMAAGGQHPTVQAPIPRDYPAADRRLA